ncbi:pilB [Mytilus coruscus]|uniref:PilB n=1 Tax=Mytilus coruscus TaxID=42192 RepID=A0A6J7ZZI9_MYTCO|nr:pilB [Mytilus coruscus]
MQEVDEKIASLIAIEKSSLEKQIDANDSEKQKLKGKISKLEDDIGKVPYHLLELQKETLMNWSNEHAKFVVTKAVQYVYQRIQTEKLVVIIGPTGSGKSACAYHVAFRLKNEYGYAIVPTRQPSDITQYYIPGTNQVIIIDDFVGTYALDEAEAVAWVKECPFIHKILSNKDQTEVILTCRKSIWHPEICERFKLQLSYAIYIQMS